MLEGLAIYILIWILQLLPCFPWWNSIGINSGISLFIIIHQIISSWSCFCTLYWKVEAIFESSVVIKHGSAVKYPLLCFHLDYKTWFQDDPEIPFTEDDYRRRKAHPNFKEHISAEKMVIKYGKTVSFVILFHDNITVLPCHNILFPLF